MKKVHLVIIDPQNDFMDSPGAALPVSGANADMDRMAAFVTKYGNKISDIHITLDSHQAIDIAHPVWWVHAQTRNAIRPFTLITEKEIVTETYTTRNPDQFDRSLDYVQQLERSGKYNLLIWPPHCLIGTWGHAIQENLMTAIYKWQTDNYRMVDYVIKGANPYTEHYGAIMAEVPDSQDPSTQLNEKLLLSLREADTILVGGEALSHCVKQTVDQLISNIGFEHIHKIVLLTDTTSAVGQTEGGPNFPEIAQHWLNEIQASGVTLTTTENIFS